MIGASRNGPCVGIPKANEPVDAGGSETAVGGELCGEYLTLVSPQDSKQLAGCGIPEMDRAVGAGGRKHTSVG